MAAIAECRAAFATLLFAAFALCTTLVGAAGQAVAQSMPPPTALRLDGSLPNGRMDDLVASQPGPVYTIDQTMGEARGGNLFHSFSFFTIGRDDTARFTAIQPFDNLIVRVTGGMQSQIHGTLHSTVLDGSGAGADLFLLNPSGILFGRGAAIDVPGSLYLSTADALHFDDGATLDLVDASAPVLSIGEPAAFGFLGAAPAADVEFVDGESGFASTILTMAPGATLAAVGGDVALAAPSGFLEVQAPGGRVGLVATGDAAATVDVDTLDVATATPERLGTISIETGASVSGLTGAVPDADQGQLWIRGGRLVVSGAFLQFGGNAGGAVRAVDVEVDDSVSFDSVGFISLASGGSQRGGDGRIVARSVSVDGVGSGVFSQSTGAGGGGNLSIRADDVTVANGAEITTEVRPLASATGSGGNLSIEADIVTLRAGGRLSSRTGAAGPGGAIDIVADRVVLDEGRIESRGNSDAPSGAVSVRATDIVVDGPGAEISIIQSGEGAAGGDLLLGDGGGSLLVIDDGLVAGQTLSSQAGPSVTISTGRLEVRDGGRVETSTLAAGPAGALDVTATSVSLSRSAGASAGGLLASSSGIGATGAGGLVRIRTDTLEVTDGAQVTTTTRGANAGAIDIVATDSVTLRGDDGVAAPSGLFARAEASSNGSGGTIDVRARTIAIEAGAEVSTQTSSPGGAGDIRLVADESIRVTGTGLAGSLVSAKTFVGTGGNVLLEAPQVEVTSGGGVDVTTLGTQPGGRVRVVADDLTLAGRSPDGTLGSTITAETRSGGAAGGIDVQLTGDLVLRDGARLTARSSGSGLAGDVTVGAARVEVVGGSSISALSTASADAGEIRLDVADSLRLSAGSVTTQAATALGGNIDVRAGRIVSLDSGSALTTSVRSGTGDGGNLSVTAPYIVVAESALIAQADAGNGGNITLTTELLLQSGDSIIDASSRLGIDGDVLSTTPAEDLSGQLAPLGAAVAGAESQLARDCAERTERAGSFTVRTGGPERRFDADALPLDGADRTDATGGKDGTDATGDPAGPDDEAADGDRASGAASASGAWPEVAQHDGGRRCLPR